MVQTLLILSVDLFHYLNIWSFLLYSQKFTYHKITFQQKFWVNRLVWQITFIIVYIFEIFIPWRGVVAFNWQWFWSCWITVLLCFMFAPITFFFVVSFLFVSSCLPLFNFFMFVTFFFVSMLVDLLLFFFLLVIPDSLGRCEYSFFIIFKVDDLFPVKIADRMVESKVVDF